MKKEKIEEEVYLSLVRTCTSLKEGKSIDAFSITRSGSTLQIDITPVKSLESVNITGIISKEDEQKSMLDIVEKHFKDERVKYFLSSDALTIHTGETYLRYDWYGGNKVILYFCSHNDGEIPIRVCSKPEELDALINMLIN